MVEYFYRVLDPETGKYLSTIPGYDYESHVTKLKFVIGINKSSVFTSIQIKTLIHRIIHCNFLYEQKNKPSSTPY